jgi:hypothetical protein
VEDVQLRFHPLADEYPLMEGEEFERLADDIAKRDLQVPILTWHGLIIDGRNRYRACLARGVKPFFIAEDHIPEGELADHIASFNEHRMHHSRAFLARKRRERIARVREGRADGKSLRTLAAEEGVSAEQVRRDLATAPAAGGTPPVAERVNGRDGKRYPAARKSDGPPPAPAAPMDPFGLPVPEALLPVFSPELEKMRGELLSVLAKAERLLGEYAASPAGAVLREMPQGVARGDGLRVLRRALKDTAPHASACPCGQAAGRPAPECVYCGGRGWLPARSCGRGGLPPEYRTVLETLRETQQ